MSLPNNPKQPSELLRVSQAALLLNVHPNTVRRWAEQGILTVRRIGPRGDRRFYRSDVEALLLSSSDWERHHEPRGVLWG